MKRLLPLLLILLLAAPTLWSESYKSWDTTNVSQDDGDTISTSQVSVGCTLACYGGGTLISAAITNRGNRKRVICNASAFAVFLGTGTAVNSVLGTAGFRISESTGTAPCYTTYSTAAFYGNAVGGSSSTVTVMQEKVAFP